MRDREQTTPETNVNGDGFLIESGIEQLKMDCRLYDEAVESYNTHLRNHRDRRDLHDIPYRQPISDHGAVEDAFAGDRGAVEKLLRHLLDQPHRDSELRRHPRTYPIHLEALEHLEIARDRLVRSLEEFHRDLGDAQSR